MVMNKKKKIIVGLTGGIASGKSSAVREFKRWGVRIVDADKIARDVLKKGTQVYENLVKKFGRTIVLPSGELNRRKIRGIVFNNIEQRKLLERITHPEIIGRIKTKLKAYAAGLVILDAPLLFEADISHLADIIVVVWTTKKLQLKRLRLRDNMDDAQGLAMINAQMRLSEKVSKADYVIRNNGSIDQLSAAVKKLYKTIWKK